ncbi:ribonuclease D [Hoeflea sp. TYP-13]|uniref:ribonuclease D n=1 Tax=Hoeflea sp. TYP-13 TaxID=3230023 RepID=UPI0034C6607D
MISTTGALEAACKTLSQSDYLTIDTEFIRETTFWPELCLIQMATDDLAVIVDPLADGIDLQPFFALMADTSVIKVFHAARQDIEIIYNLGELIPHPIFDTQVAAMVCGFGDSVSYDQLVQKTVGAQIDKTSRFTDWRQRPLSDKQLNYALADVTHLRGVYKMLNKRLREEGREHWVKEEMDILESASTYDLHPDEAWTRLRMRVRKPHELAIMKHVAAWREREARQRNVPRRRVLKDDAIYEIAQQQPRDTGALGRLRTIPKGWERSQAAGSIIDAVSTALAMPKDEMPRLNKPAQAPEGAAAASELLKVLLKMTTEKHGVAPKVIANTDDLERIAAEGEKAEVGALSGWRRELFGEKALKLLRGEMALRFIDRKVEVVELQD